MKRTDRDREGRLEAQRRQGGGIEAEGSRFVADPSEHDPAGTAVDDRKIHKAFGAIGSLRGEDGVELERAVEVLRGRWRA